MSLHTIINKVKESVSNMLKVLPNNDQYLKEYNEVQSKLVSLQCENIERAFTNLLAAHEVSIIKII